MDSFVYTTFPKRFFRRCGQFCFLAVFIIFSLIVSWSHVRAETKQVDNPSKKQDLETKRERKEIVIVGGDMAGLTAAYFLKHRDILLLEESGAFGGQMASGSFAGFNYPRGIAYIGMPQGPIGSIVDELGLEPVEIPEPSEGFYYDGKFYFGPNATKELLSANSSAEEYNRFVNTVGKIAKAHGDNDNSELSDELALLDKITAREWFEREKFPDVFIDIYNSQALGVFGAGLSEISALSFIPEIGFQFERFESVVDPNDSNQREGPEETEKFSDAVTFQGGLSELPEAIIKKLGSIAKSGAKVTQIIPRDGIYEIAYIDKSGITSFVEAGAVIMAVPPSVALKIGELVLSQEQKDILKKIVYSNYATVTLFSSTPVFEQAFNLSVGKGFSFSDLYDSSWVHRAYDPELNSIKERALCAHVPGSSVEAGSIEKISDEDLLASVIDGVERIFPKSRGSFVGHDIQRFNLAFPIMAPGSYERLIKLNKLNQGECLLAGDFMIYPTIEAAAESGYLAAMRLDELPGQEGAQKKERKP
ncbi:MAG: FAD-dependent oxidoreductase [Pseudomonadota bacterium]